VAKAIKPDPIHPPHRPAGDLPATAMQTRPQPGNRDDDSASVVKFVCLTTSAAIAGIVTVVGIAAWYTIGGLASTAIGVIGTITTAAIGVAATHVHRNRRRGR
jgi:hypothetical protein